MGAKISGRTLTMGTLVTCSRSSMKSFSELKSLPDCDPATPTPQNHARRTAVSASKLNVPSFPHAPQQHLQSIAIH